MAVRNKLRIFMAEDRMTIRDVHKKTGLSEITISKLYNEKSNTIAFETIEKICDLFSCDIGEMFYFENIECDK